MQLTNIDMAQNEVTFWYKGDQVDPARVDKTDLVLVWVCKTCWKVPVDLAEVTDDYDEEDDVPYVVAHRLQTRYTMLINNIPTAICESCYTKRKKLLTESLEKFNVFQTLMIDGKVAKVPKHLMVNIKNEVTQEEK